VDLKPPLIDLEDYDKSTGRKQEKSVQRERLSEGDYMYCLYWISVEDHTDIHSEGYVGITRNFSERMRAHRKNRRVTPLTNAIKKYSWDTLIIRVLINGISLEDALFLERLYRPSQHIGWNCQSGGEIGVEPEWYSIKENSDKHRNATSIATKIAIESKDSHEARSNRAKESWRKTRDKRIEAVTGEKNPKALLTESQVKRIKYELIPNGLSNTEIANMFNVKHYVISFIRSGKNWSHI
jgi:hypothetical protein